MRLLICAGMTGGGVYPALAVLHTLNVKATSVLWIGSEGGMEAEILTKQKITYTSIPAAGVHGVGLTSPPGNLLRLVRGYFKARQIIHQYQPHVIFFTGGYLSIPVALAGSHIPSVVFIPDIEPGAALNFLVRRANLIAVSAENTRKFIPRTKKVEITGYPIRSELKKWTRERARKALGLSRDLPVVLVFGGSKGAQSINQALLPILSELLKDTQVLHITGQSNWEETHQAAASLPQSLSNRYHAYPFMHEQMGAALAIADLAVCRAGASTLGELPFFGLPAILVPYPHAWRYQHTNAEYLVRHGGSLLLEDKDLGEKLLTTVINLIHDKSALSGMRKAMRSLARPDAAQRIGELLFKVATSKGVNPSW